MKTFINLFFFLFLSTSVPINAQESDDYIEFNDRKNIVHGVYLGIVTHYGEIKGKDTYLLGVKFAYVANRQFEVGFVVKGLYSNQNFTGLLSTNEDLASIYMGLHFEPILFRESIINLSFPLLIGGGAAKYVDGNLVSRNDELEIDFKEGIDDWDSFFVLEPGVNLLFNVSRYFQIEAGVRYRLSSKITINPSSVNRINGFSAGLGIKLGVFNLGRNRYKKHL